MVLKWKRWITLLYRLSLVFLGHPPPHHYRIWMNEMNGLARTFRSYSLDDVVLLTLRNPTRPLIDNYCTIWLHCKCVSLRNFKTPDIYFPWQKEGQHGSYIWLPETFHIRLFLVDSGIILRRRKSRFISLSVLECMLFANCFLDS